MATVASDVREIPLTQGLVALVDAADYEFLAKYKWCASRRASRMRYGLVYATTNVPRPMRGHIKMHHLIMAAPDGCVTDHRNGNGLDNRRSNLRIATLSQNNMNARLRSNNTSGFKGVFFRPRGKWQAMIWKNYVSYSLGYHETPEQAAIAYDAKARELFGEFALLNFPET